MLKKEQLEALFTELSREWKATPEYESLLRDAHLGIAYFDAGRPLGPDIDVRVATLIEKYSSEE